MKLIRQSVYTSVTTHTATFSSAQTEYQQIFTAPTWKRYLLIYHISMNSHSSCCNLHITRRVVPVNTWHFCAYSFHYSINTPRYPQTLKITISNNMQGSCVVNIEETRYKNIFVHFHNRRNANSRWSIRALNAIILSYVTGAEKGNRFHLSHVLTLRNSFPPPKFSVFTRLLDRNS